MKNLIDAFVWLEHLSANHPDLMRMIHCEYHDCGGQDEAHGTSSDCECKKESCIDFEMLRTSLRDPFLKNAIEIIEKDIDVKGILPIRLGLSCTPSSCDFLTVQEFGELYVGCPFKLSVFRDSELLFETSGKIGDKLTSVYDVKKICGGQKITYNFEVVTPDGVGTHAEDVDPIPAPKKTSRYVEAFIKLDPTRKPSFKTDDSSDSSDSSSNANIKNL